MTMAHTPAWDELQWSCKYRNSLAFRDKAYVGQLVFMYNKPNHEWKPYWVVDADYINGTYDVASAYGDERKRGLKAQEFGVAIDKMGKTYHELH